MLKRYKYTINIINLSQMLRALIILDYQNNKPNVNIKYFLLPIK